MKSLSAAIIVLCGAVCLALGEVLTYLAPHHEIKSSEFFGRRIVLDEPFLESDGGKITIAGIAIAAIGLGAWSWSFWRESTTR